MTTSFCNGCASYRCSRANWSSSTLRFSHSPVCETCSNAAASRQMDKPSNVLILGSFSLFSASIATSLQRGRGDACRPVAALQCLFGLSQLLVRLRRQQQVLAYLLRQPQRLVDDQRFVGQA